MHFIHPSSRTIDALLHCRHISAVIPLPIDATVGVFAGTFACADSAGTTPIVASISASAPAVDSDGCFLLNPPPPVNCSAILWRGLRLTNARQIILPMLYPYPD